MFQRFLDIFYCIKDPHPNPLPITGEGTKYKFSLARPFSRNRENGRMRALPLRKLFGFFFFFAFLVSFHHKPLLQNRRAIIG